MRKTGAAPKSAAASSCSSVGKESSFCKTESYEQALAQFDNAIRDGKEHPGRRVCPCGLPGAG